jgi:hypothetical protein
VVRLEKGAAVRKRVGRDIKHRHQLRLALKGQQSISCSPNHYVPSRTFHEAFSARLAVR